MRKLKQMMAVLLTASMTLSMLTPAWAAGSRENIGANVGAVDAVVRIDYIQTLEELKKRDIQAELRKGQTTLGTVSLTSTTDGTLGGYPVQVSLRDREGGELIGNALPGTLDLSVTGLPQGSYALHFTGNGYAACEVPFKIENYSQHIEVGTGDGTFALGDFDGNGRVDEKDRDALANALGSTQSTDQNTYDLNGDGKIDIIDLAYINHNTNITGGEPVVQDTTCLAVRLDEAEMLANLQATRTEVKAGSIVDLFQENDSGVQFQRVGAERGNIVIPIPLAQPIEAQELKITTPDSSSGAIQTGTVTVDYEDGTNETVLFDHTLPQGVHAVTRTPGTNVITIPLGKRVAVKKITITVTKTAGAYATVESIRFLKEIVSEGMTEPNSEVKNLKAAAGNEQVSLAWNELPNVSGYQVEYWQEDRESARRQLNVDKNKAVITGLDNLKTYYFTVTPTDGSWRGRSCPAVTAMPKPANAPAAPDMVTVKSLDGQLAVSWKQAENATWYEVYYTDRENASTSDYQRFGDRITGTSVTITGLTNGITYYIYIIAGNDVGRSGPSRISVGIPVATDYSRPEGIPTQGILDNSKIESIRLAAAGNYDAGSYTAGAPFRPENMIDGDFRTHWTAGGNYWGNEHVEVTFKEPVDLTTAIWVPRLDGSYPSNLRAYSVLVWYEGEDLTKPGHHLTKGTDKGGGSDDEVLTWPNLPNYSTAAKDKFAIVPFGPAKNIKRISVAVEQKGYDRVSLSELMFMEYDPAHCLPDNITALFADGLHTQLASGVTQEQIDNLKARLESSERYYYLDVAAMTDELALAQELLNGKAASGVVLKGIQSRSGSADSAKYGQGGSGLQPLGVAAKAGDEITIYASGIPEGESVTVYASQFNAEASAWRAGMGTLANGRNILTVPKIGSQNTERGGSLYLAYSGSGADQIQLHVRRAVDIPTLELSDWYTLSDTVRKERIEAYADELTAYVSAQGINSSNAGTKCLNVTEISMPTVLLSVPAAAVLNANGLNHADKVENLYQNVLAWEDLMHICKTTQGIDNTYGKNDMTSRQNIRCMQMFTGAFMYAAGNHIGIGYGSCAGVVSGKPIASLDENASANSLFGWGIAHEIGHNMDKLGRAEITNNIYALMAQTYDGKQNTLPSRLEKSGKYANIFTKTAQGWSGESNDVFVQLGMYWQLHLAYDDGEHPMDFYNRFFKAWKSGEYTKGLTNLSYDEKVALTASGTAGKNLTEFFERWGMTLSSEVKNMLSSYETEDRAIWYLSDQSRRDRLSGMAPAQGGVSAEAKLNGGNRIMVTITPSITGSIQGFEIIRNGNPVAFVLPGDNGAAVYEDVIGSANHRTYTYQVIAYDTLGNEVGNTANAGDVRVAYDKTVDPSAYTIERSGDTLTFRFKERTSVSGLKLTGASRPANGAYRISVDASFTAEDKTLIEKTVTARAGSFDQGNQAADAANSYLVYFQKPGVEADDTRIWTYDATAVTVAGIPEAMDQNDIRLVSYAGDDIAFLEDGAVGRLSAEYIYGDGPEDLIEKDTLIVVGTYRGDPRFNTIKIMGRFAKTTAEDDAETTYEERPIDGYALLFAEIPEDQQVSDISDGLFIFVPNVQREAELQEITETSPSSCDGVNLLPSQMKAVFSRTDVPDDAGSQRVTAETLWIWTPGGEDLPTIVLEEGLK